MANGVIDNFYEFGPLNGGAPKQAVILLHGVGSNGQDLISLAPHWAKALPDAIFISPDAPFVCDMVPPGYPNSYQWFSLLNRDLKVMLEGVEGVQSAVDGFINETLRKYDLSADSLALVGFSQGTMTGLYVGPRYKDKLAGILGYSGALIGENSLNEEDVQKIPVHLIHGEADDVVPVQAHGHASKALEDAGFEVSGYTTPGLPHSIDEEGIESGAAFLKSIF